MCFTTSESINELAQSLAKAQGEFTNPHKNREVVVQTQKGGSYKFVYAEFVMSLEATRKQLATNGLSVVQCIDTDSKGDVLLTRLMHASGQWLQFTTPIFSGGPGAQGFASGVTYAKRQSYNALLCLAADDDDDGNAADGNRATFADKKPPAQRKTPPKQEQTDTRKMAKDYEGAMSPEELEQFVTSRNTFTERIAKADSLMTLDEIAADLKTSHERIKGVVRPLWVARKKVLQGEQLPPEENP